MKNLVKGLAALTVVALMSSCGGGGGGGTGSVGGGGSTGGGTPSIVLYPYETVYGDICSSSAPTPGCTFSRSTGTRISVSADPDYDKYGYGSDDLWYVKFDTSGNAKVYNDLGTYQYTADISEFAGFIGGNTIGVGTTGFFWENVSNGTYWLGKNGVLYNANMIDSNFGKAINNKNAGKAMQKDILALKSAANKQLIAKGAAKLMKNYGFKADKATAVATSLNNFAVLADAQRGKITGADLNKTFKGTFGVEFSQALAAVKGLQVGNLDGMREVTNRSAAALGLKPHEAQEFIKGMYADALKQYGYDVKDVNW